MHPAPTRAGRRNCDYPRHVDVKYAALMRRRTFRGGSFQ